MISAGDFRNGITIEIDSNIFQIIEFQHVKPGKGAAFVRTKLKNIKNGGVIEKTFRPNEKCPQARIERNDLQYLYRDEDLFYFMDVENYEQMALDSSSIGDSLKFVKENEMVKKDMITNEVVLIGYICKKPIYRQTPFGREIADLLLAVNRAYNKSDYIPTIAWGRNARFCQNLEVGAQVKIIGRVQSSNYSKKFEDGTLQTRTASEASISSIELVNEEEENKDVI